MYKECFTIYKEGMVAMKKIYKTIGIIVLTSFLMLACSPKDEDLTETPSETNQVDKTDDNKVVDKTDDKKEAASGEIKSKVLREMMNAKEFTLEMKQTIQIGDLEMDMMISSVVSNDKTYMKTESNDSSLEIVEKDDKSYLIMHDAKMIIESNRVEDDDEPEFDNGTIVHEDMKFVKEGKEEFLGKKRSYEEYELDEGTVKYYFDGKNIAGMEMKIYADELTDEIDDDVDIEFDEATIKVEILSYKESADQSVFELPEDYEVVGN